MRETNSDLIGRVYTVDWDRRNDPRTIVTVIAANGEMVTVRNHAGQEWLVWADLVRDIVL